VLYLAVMRCCLKARRVVPCHLQYTLTLYISSSHVRLLDLDQSTVVVLYYVLDIDIE
jgi:hypothetical protein